jgi:Bax protein
VPVSLVLAQGILESGYGTSAAARQKRSLFGQMASKTSVETFESLSECVYSYVRNLNRNKAYDAFQNTRYTMRTTGKPLCAVTLAGGLLKYSELGQAYVSKIRKMIRAYGLDAYDKTQLTDA